jgi:hypothetical protein
MQGRTILGVAAELLEIGKISLEVSMLRRTRFIPPYLHGEPLPRRISIFRDGCFQANHHVHPLAAQRRLQGGSSDSESDEEFSPESESDSEGNASSDSSDSESE